MQIYSVSPNELIKSFWCHRELIATLAKREVIGRYRGSIMGVLWSFFNPILLLLVYTFVFGVVFKARWNVSSESKEEFALILFAGLMVFNLFSECINRAPGLVLNNVNYVKKVVFPLEILPCVQMCSALFHTGISLVVWLLAYLILCGVPQPTIFLIPIAILPLLLFTLGLSWFLASLGVYLRDVSQFIGFVTTALMFLSPIFYPASALPEHLRLWLTLNPVASTIEQVRAVSFFGEMLDPLSFLMHTSFAAGCFFLGFAWFQKTRRGFADVL